MKRKAREQLANGLNDIQSALNSLEDSETKLTKVSESSVERGDEEPTQTGKLASKMKPGQIGEGKSVTLSKQQRKRVL